MFVWLWPISSGTAGPIWLIFFLLAPSWSRDGLRPKKFRIRDPVFPDKTGSWIRIFLAKNQPLDQDGANKKRISQIGPAVPEEIGNIHTYTQTLCCYIMEITLDLLQSID